MPTGYRYFNAEIRERITAAFPDRATPMLDIGCGDGKFRDLFRDYTAMDAVEVWEPYLERFQLRERYRDVRCVNANYLTVSSLREYDVVFMGDVLEHLTVDEAQRILLRIEEAGCAAVVVVPWEMEQGPWEGNPYEEHLQPDLTPERMAERYPQLQLVHKNNVCGVYFRNKWGLNQRDNPYEKVSERELLVDTEQLKQAHLIIATPMFNGRATSQYMCSLWNTTHKLRDLGINHAWHIVQGSTVERARNLLVARFLSIPEATHLLWVDADQGWKPEDVLRLLALDRDVLGVPIRKKTDRLDWNVSFHGTEARLQGGTLQCDEIGTGFTLVKRHVFERMMKEFPERKLEPSDLELVKHGPHVKEYYYAFYAPTLEGHSFVGEDLAFCRLWSSIGGEVWCDPSGCISHIGDYDYSGAYSAMIQGVKT